MAPKPEGSLMELFGDQVNKIIVDTSACSTLV